MKNLIDDLIKIAFEAGEEIMKVYDTPLQVEYKEDKSPLTEADKRAHMVIYKRLQEISSFPVLSEEGKDISYNVRKKWEYFWMVDPLDGTKEFIKRNGEFTVNIALIHKNRPVAGVVYAPVLDVMYYGGEEIGAFKLQNGSEIKLDGKKERSVYKKSVTVVASKSHLNKETEEFINQLKNYFDEIKTVSVGSSLKICLLAERKADFYPRLAPTMEWDTAAAHAILSAAGGKIYKYSESFDLKKTDNFPELEYNKENLLNPYFVAIGPDVY
ncbi:3'(2'),5'-bisphosphate nucleotidase CysQ [Persephonella sp.]